VQVVRTDTPRNAITPVVTFRVALDAEPGNASPALARLLIEIDRRRRERIAAEQTTQPEPQSQEP
jgi:hypothetical protein